MSTRCRSIVQTHALLSSATVVSLKKRLQKYKNLCVSPLLSAGGGLSVAEHDATRGKGRESRGVLV